MRGQVLLNCADVVGERRRGDGFGQDADAGAAFGPLLGQHLPQGAKEGAPGADLVLVCERLGAVRVVEGEDAGLREKIAGAQAGGVLGVAFHLGGPPQWLSTSTPVPTPPNVIAVA